MGAWVLLKLWNACENDFSVSNAPPSAGSIFNEKSKRCLAWTPVLTHLPHDKVKRISTAPIRRYLTNVMRLRHVMFSRRSSAFYGYCRRMATLMCASSKAMMLYNARLGIYVWAVWRSETNLCFSTCDSLRGTNIIYSIPFNWQKNLWLPWV